MENTTDSVSFLDNYNRSDNSSKEPLLVDKYDEVQVVVWVSCGFTSLMCLYVAMLQIGYRLLQSTRSMVILSFLAMTGITEICYVICLTSTKLPGQALCTTIAALFHFCCVSCFTWFFSYVLFLANKLHSKNLSAGLYAVLGWGLPACFVVISLIWRYQDYRDGTLCWISTDGYLDLALKVPIILFLLISIVVLLHILRIFLIMRKNFRHSVKIKRTGVDIITCLVLVPFMGATWIFGVFAATSDVLWINVAFAVSNILMGILLFCCMCIFNQEIQHAREKYKNEKSFTDIFSRNKDDIKRVKHGQPREGRRSRIATRTHMLFPRKPSLDIDDAEHEMFKAAPEEIDVQLEPSTSQSVQKPFKDEPEPPDKPNRYSMASSTADSSSHLLPLSTTKRQDDTKLKTIEQQKPSTSKNITSEHKAPIAQTESDEDAL